MATLQCSCLENPRDGGAWWAAVSGVAQSRTRLKWLSSSSSFGGKSLCYQGASLIAQLIKNPPATQETWVRSLGWEDPLEKGKAIHSSILAWRIPQMSPWGPKESDTTERLQFYFSLSLFTFMHWRREWQHSSVLAWRISWIEEPGRL